MRIAVTGANGQIGRYLAARLADSAAAQVVAVCRNRVGAGMLSGLPCETRVGSLSQPAAAQTTIGDCDTVVHCALAGGSSGPARAENLAMIGAIAAIPRVKTLIYLSSIAVYSSCIEGGVNRFEAPRPDTTYGRDKLACEKAALRALRGPGRRCVILRLGHVYGAYTAWSRHLLESAQAIGFTLPFSGQLPSNAIRIDRVGDGIVRLLHDPTSAGIYNLADQPLRSWAGLYQWHTGAAEIPAAAAMAAAQSCRNRKAIIGAKRHPLIRAVQELMRAWGSLRLGLVSGSPSIRALAESAFTHLPMAWQEPIRFAYQKAAAAADIKAAASSTPLIEAWLYSDCMPGRQLELPADCAEAQQRELLAAWSRTLIRTEGPWLDLIAQDSLIGEDRLIGGDRSRTASGPRAVRAAIC